MMAVIIDYGNATLGTARLKAPFHARIQGDGFVNRCQLYIQFEADGDGCRGIEHVVNSRHAQEEFS